jgi:hypothetical protein
MILEQSIASYNKSTQSLILDFGDTDDRVHGELEGRAYNSRCGNYSFFSPSHVQRRETAGQLSSADQPPRGLSLGCGV